LPFGAALQGIIKTSIQKRPKKRPNETPLSNRKYNKQWQALQPISQRLPIRVGIGSKFFTVPVEDTVANREIVKSIGATIARG
jgi:hypothetical protein